MKRIGAVKVIRRFKPGNKMNFRVKSGETFLVETLDCFNNKITDESITIEEVADVEEMLCTGPIAVSGAEPGNVLKVEILDIKTKSPGIATTHKGSGVLGEKMVDKTKFFDLKGEKIQFSEKISLKQQPMIGNIAVMPGDEDNRVGRPLLLAGGNVDCTDIKSGSTVYFPVFVKGAGLAVGDAHALQGNGEVCGSGIECNAMVKIKASVLKGLSLDRPCIETKENFMALAVADTLEEAAKIATSDMAGFLIKKFGFSLEDAVMLISVAGNIRVCQLSNKRISATCALPKKIIRFDDIAGGLRGKKFKPKVTVLIVTYNYGRFIEKAVESALSQTMPLNLIEIIVVDDGSTDNTQEILRKFSKKIKVYKIKNSGSTAGSNFGLKKAKGEYVMKLDADDWFEPETLQQMAAELDKDARLGFVYCDIRLIKKGVKRIVSLKKFNLFKTLACNIMFRRNVLMQVAVNGKVYDEKLPFFEEYDLLLRVMKKFKGKHVAKPLYNYLKHGRNMTCDREKIKKGLAVFKRKYGFCGKIL